MAVLNDSTGTLMSCAHKNLNCRIGVIIGKNNTNPVFIVDKTKKNLWDYQSMGFQCCTSFLTV